jgi:hypothetical protein
MVDMNAYVLFRVNQGLNTVCGKGCPGREAHWLNPLGLSRYLISIENSRSLCYVTGCHGPLCGGVMVTRRQVDPVRELAARLLLSILRFPEVLNLLQPFQFFYLVAWSTCHTFMCVCMPLLCGHPRRLQVGVAIRSPRARFQVFSTLYGCWDPNLNPLEEQYSHLNSWPSLQPCKLYF